MWKHLKRKILTKHWNYRKKKQKEWVLLSFIKSLQITEAVTQKCRIAILKNSRKFREKHPRWCIFLDLANKNIPSSIIFWKFSQIFSEQLFWRISPDCYSWDLFGKGVVTVLCSKQSLRSVKIATLENSRKFPEKIRDGVLFKY